METFRQFDVVDAFGRSWHVLFKWMQTAISLRHSDTVDVKFILKAGEDSQVEKTIAIPHATLLKLSARSGRELTDSWCCRLAVKHLRHVLETAEDLEKDLIAIPAGDLERYAAEIREEEQAAISASSRK